jgi:hypothetical protein
MHKMTRRALKLNRETLRSLDVPEMSGVAGGAPIPTTFRTMNASLCPCITQTCLASGCNTCTTTTTAA